MTQYIFEAVHYQGKQGKDDYYAVDVAEKVGTAIMRRTTISLVDAEKIISHIFDNAYSVEKTKGFIKPRDSDGKRS